ncbi:MAG: nucleotidyltransferase domain-containing protein [Nanoarchaeota archaeon]
MTIKYNIAQIKNRILPILKANRVTKAGIFGSYARGEQKKGSDVDILVEINDENMDFIDFIKLKNLIEKSLKKKIDLVEYSCIRQEIKKSVLSDEIPILRLRKCSLRNLGDFSSETERTFSS